MSALEELYERDWRWAIDRLKEVPTEPCPVCGKPVTLGMACNETVSRAEVWARFCLGEVSP